MKRNLLSLALGWLFKPAVPRGLQAGQIVWPNDWSIDDARRLGLPVVKPGVDNPLLPPRQIDWGVVIIGILTVILWMAVMMMYIGKFLEDDTWMILRDFGLLGPK